MRTKVRELEARLIQAQSAAECLIVLVELAETHANTHRNREGLRCAREALNIARARGDLIAAGRSLCVAARCHYQRGDYVAAAAAGFDAVQAFGSDDHGGRSSALRHVALALLAVESFDLAENMAQRATDDAVQCGDAAAEACARSVLGLILVHRARFAGARRRFREAAAIQRRLGETAKLKRSTIQIGHGYRAQANEVAQRGEAECARMLWRQAIRVYRVSIRTGASPSEDALALAAIAECECRLGNPAGALEALHTAHEHSAGGLAPEVRARCHLWESHALKALGKIDAARLAAENARSAAEQLDHDLILAECLKAESELSDLCGRFESAHDLESRAERVILERSAAFAGAREELMQLMARQAEVVPAFLRAVA